MTDRAEALEAELAELVKLADQMDYISQHGGHLWPDKSKKVASALRRLAAAQEQKPVAWRFRYPHWNKDDWSYITSEPHNPSTLIKEPLYAAPQPTASQDTTDDGGGVQEQLAIALAENMALRAANTKLVLAERNRIETALSNPAAADSNASAEARLKEAFSRYLDEQIAKASELQKNAYAAGNDRKGEKYHGIHCALYEVKMEFESLSTNPHASAEARLRDAMQMLAECDGSPNNVASAEVLAARVRSIAKYALSTDPHASDFPKLTGNIAKDVEAATKRVAEWRDAKKLLIQTARSARIGLETITERWPGKHQDAALKDLTIAEREYSRKYLDESDCDNQERADCGTARCRDLGCFGVCEPSDHPADVTTEELASFIAPRSPATTMTWANNLAASILHAFKVEHRK